MGLNSGLKGVAADAALFNFNLQHFFAGVRSVYGVAHVDNPYT